MSFANIIGTGIYVPEKIVTNEDLSRILDEDINPFVTSVLGIRERHVCAGAGPFGGASWAATGRQPANRTQGLRTLWPLSCDDSCRQRAEGDVVGQLWALWQT